MSRLLAIEANHLIRVLHLGFRCLIFSKSLIALLTPPSFEPPLGGNLLGNSILHLSCCFLFFAFVGVGSEVALKLSSLAAAEETNLPAFEDGLIWYAYSWRNEFLGLGGGL